MLISIDSKDYLTLKNSETNKSIKFISPDVYFSQALRAYCEYENMSEVEFSIRTISSGESMLLFSSGYQILVSSLVAFELANRMILLNTNYQHIEQKD